MRKKVLSTLKIYVTIVLGALIAALGINLFLAPMQIVAGGASGVAIVIHYLTGFPIGLSMLAINIPLFVIGMKALGSGFAFRSLFGTIVYSLLTDFLAFLPPITGQPLLAALAGGTMLGLGLGTVLLTGATTGGTDIVATLAHKIIRVINMGQWIFIIDFIIIGISGYLFHNYDLSLYGLISLFLSSYLIDFIIQGANTAKMVYIISPKYKQIAEIILQELSRGVTGIHARGMYACEDKMMLMCVVKNFEIQKLERTVNSCDPNAFLIFTQVRQVTGEGFHAYPMH